jgi:hypothetical protein
MGTTNAIVPDSPRPAGRKKDFERSTVRPDCWAKLEAMGLTRPKGRAKAFISTDGCEV